LYSHFATANKLHILFFDDLRWNKQAQPAWKNSSLSFKKYEKNKNIAITVYSILKNKKENKNREIRKNTKNSFFLNICCVMV